jgi:enoyl-CoA hydratase/carnithine racemase
MNYETILAEMHDQHIGKITLNRPDKLNTFNSQLASELHHALLEFDNKEEIRVIVIKGAGKTFCAGIDVHELEGKSALEYKAWIEHMEQPLIVISKMATPVIAQVQGVAAANGMGLAVSADLTIAASNSKMGLTAIKVGLNCVGPVIPVARIVGRKKALELLLFGDLIKAPEALDLGLVNRMVAPEELEAQALKWASTLAKRSPVAVQIAKRAFYGSEDMGYLNQFDYMNDAFARLCTTEDAKEGVASFFEKRVPKWKGF